MALTRRALGRGIESLETRRLMAADVWVGRGMVSEPVLEPVVEEIAPIQRGDWGHDDAKQGQWQVRDDAFADDADDDWVCDLDCIIVIYVVDW